MASSMPNSRHNRSIFGRLGHGLQAWLQNLYRQTFKRGDFEMLFIGLGMLVFPILALQAAEWTGDLYILFPITIIALLISHLLARSGFSEGYALFLTMLYGFATIIVAHMLTLSGGSFFRATRYAIATTPHMG